MPYENGGHAGAPIPLEKNGTEEGNHNEKSDEYQYLNLVKKIIDSGNDKG